MCKLSHGQAWRMTTRVVIMGEEEKEVEMGRGRERLGIRLRFAEV